MKIYLLKGLPAYLTWYIYNDYHFKIEKLISVEENLELLVSSEDEVLAYRYDHPEDMKWMVNNDGKWNLTKKGKNYIKSEKILFAILNIK